MAISSAHFVVYVGPAQADIFNFAICSGPDYGAVIPALGCTAICVPLTVDYWGSKFPFGASLDVNSAWLTSPFLEAWHVPASKRSRFT